MRELPPHLLKGGCRDRFSNHAIGRSASLAGQAGGPVQDRLGVAELVEVKRKSRERRGDSTCYSLKKCQV